MTTRESDCDAHPGGSEPLPCQADGHLPGIRGEGIDSCPPAPARQPGPSDPARDDCACELSILVPAYREGPAIHQSVERIMGCAVQATPAFELVIVDDGSDDSTWDHIVSLARQYPEIRGIRLSRNFGKDAAISAGLSLTVGKAVLVMDADMQHPPELIPQFHAMWKQGYDIVDGIKRDRRDESLVRRWCSAAFNRLALLSTRLDLQNSTDFKLLSRDVVSAWASMRESRLFFRGTVEWLGFRRARVPFDVAPSVRPVSTWSLARLVGLSVRAIVSFSSVPLRVAHVISLIFIVFGGVLGVEALWLKFRHQAVDGFTTVIMVQLIQGGLTLGVLAVISEYLAAIYDEVKARPRFVVAAVTGRMKSGPDLAVPS